MHRLAAHRELLKRNDRPITRIEVSRIDLARQRTDHAPRPPIQRMWQRVTGLRGCCKNWPLQIGGEPEKHERSLVRWRRQRFELSGRWVEATPNGEACSIGTALQVMKPGKVLRHFSGVPAYCSRLS
jgi:hypothetical protein